MTAMNKFYNGVSYYTFATLKVGFPHDTRACWYCPMMDTERGTGRYICRRTHEYLIDPERTVGEECVLEFEKEN